MIQMHWFLWLLPMLLFGLVSVAGAEELTEEGWEYGIARAFSGRIGEIKEELASIEDELPSLPGLPVSDQGGTGGFASLHPQAEPKEGDEIWVELRWEKSATVDLVGLVPARRFGVGGLETQFGMPDTFHVELLDVGGEVIAEVGEELELWGDSVRSGHPFLYKVSPPVAASGVRISAGSLRLDSDVSDRFVHAWAEVFVFSGDRNLARGASVTSASGLAPLAPWEWGKDFLIDGQTPLGLPEVPAGDHQNIGWISEGQSKASNKVWLELDLGEEKEFDGVRLFPAKRPTVDLPSGFGFPSRFTLSVSNSATRRASGKLILEEKVELGNPGDSPVYLPIERCKGRFVKIEVSQLWKEYDNYPAFFALSEIEVLDGDTNLALGAAVSSPNGMGTIMAPGSRFWSAVSLTDGFGPEGRLVSRREWLVELDRRLGLERSRFELQQELRGIIDGWRRVGLTAFAVVAVLGGFGLIALPIRYRVREKRELSRVRERIAGDLHDEVGSNLGSIQMFADLAEGRSGSSDELKRIQRIAAETVSAVRDIVWLLRPQGDHRIGTVEHLRETASIMLESHEWEFTANEAAWQCELSDEESRNLFLLFREGLHNILRHSGASQVRLRVETDEREFRLEISDNGRGIDPERLKRPSTLRALHQRVEALGAKFEVESELEKGTRLDLRIPLNEKRSSSG